MSDFALRYRYIETGAHIEGAYRYSLFRRWRRHAPVLVVGMLNPSDADAMIDDPTVRRVVRFADKEDFGAVCIVNMAARRSRHPRDVWGLAAAEGPANQSAIREALRRHGPLMLVAWGVNAKRLHPVLVARALETMRNAHMLALRVTGSGFPEHPLYLPSSCRLHRVIPADQRGRVSVLERASA